MSSSIGDANTRLRKGDKEQYTPEECVVKGKEMISRMASAKKNTTPDSSKDIKDLENFDKRYWWKCYGEEEKVTTKGTPYNTFVMTTTPRRTTPNPASFSNSISQDGRILHRFSNDNRGDKTHMSWNALMNVMVAKTKGVNTEQDHPDFDRIGRVREIVHQIITTMTWRQAAAHIVASQKLSEEKWHDFEPGTDEFAMMLGTHQGKGDAWLLIDYPWKFEGVEIDKIRINLAKREMRVILKRITSPKSVSTGLAESRSRSSGRDNRSGRDPRTKDHKGKGKEGGSGSGSRNNTTARGRTGDRKGDQKEQDAEAEVNTNARKSGGKSKTPEDTGMRAGRKKDKKHNAVTIGTSTNIPRSKPKAPDAKTKAPASKPVSGGASVGESRLGKNIATFRGLAKTALVLKASKPKIGPAASVVGQPKIGDPAPSKITRGAVSTSKLKTEMGTKRLQTKAIK